jgi:hypothetical protein
MGLRKPTCRSSSPTSILPLPAVIMYTGSEGCSWGRGLGPGATSTQVAVRPTSDKSPRCKGM